MTEINVCQNCVHYRQHYIKAGRSYRSIRKGHCVYPRLKNRENETPACAHFKARPPKEDSGSQ